MLLPATLELLGPITWRLPRWLDDRLPHVNIEGAGAAPAEPGAIALGETAEREPAATVGPGRI
jgi:hypothetical protein